MGNKVIGKCPVCGNRLKVVKLSCNRCETTLTGQFELDRLSRLDEDEKRFVEIFIKNRGSIKEVEKDLGVSYPTVRRMLENVIASLGYESKPKEANVNKAEILEKLEKGEINAEEALTSLKGEE